MCVKCDAQIKLIWVQESSIVSLWSRSANLCVISWISCGASCFLLNSFNACRQLHVWVMEQMHTNLLLRRLYECPVNAVMKPDSLAEARVVCEAVLISVTAVKSNIFNIISFVFAHSDGESQSCELTNRSSVSLLLWLCFHVPPWWHPLASPLRFLLSWYFWYPDGLRRGAGGGGYACEHAICVIAYDSSQWASSGLSVMMDFCMTWNQQESLLRGPFSQRFSTTRLFVVTEISPWWPLREMQVSNCPVLLRQKLPAAKTHSTNSWL